MFKAQIKNKNECVNEWKWKVSHTHQSVDILSLYPVLYWFRILLHEEVREGCIQTTVSMHLWRLLLYILTSYGADKKKSKHLR